MTRKSDRRATADEKLLVTNNDPIKIHLNGFKVLDFLRTASLIETHGGKVVPPDERTLVLCSPGCPRSTEFLQFDIQWLHDSIEQNERQDIGKYLLPPVQLTKDSDEARPLQKPPNICNGPSESPRDSRPSSASTTPNVEKPPNSAPKLGESANGLADGTDDSSPISPVSLPEDTNHTSPMSPQALDDNSTCELNRTDYLENYSSDVDKLIDDRERNANSVDDVNERDTVWNGCWRFANRAVGSEKNPIMDLNDNCTGESACPAAKSSHLWSDSSDDDGKMEVETAEGECAETLPSETTPDASVQVHSLREIIFSREDDLKIIRYLIDKNSIPRVRGTSVWLQMEYDKILPNRAAATLKYRFEEKLITNINQYIDDPVALEQFNAVNADAQNARDGNGD